MGEQIAETADRERLVEEVRAERRDDPDAAAGLGGRRSQALQDVEPLVLVLDQGEHLLELVEDDQEFRIRVGKDAVDRSEETSRVALELVQQGRRRRDGQPQQRRFELTERMSAGEHVDHVPALGAGQRAATERRHEAGSDHRGLPRTRRSHDGEEPRAGLILLEPSEQSLRDPFASEEVRRVGLEERPQSLVGVADLAGRHGHARCIPLERSADGRGQLEGVGESILRVLGGRAPDHAIERGRQIGAHLPDRRDRVHEVVIQERRQRRLGEGRRAREHLVGHDPERIDVGSEAKQDRA